MTPRPLPPRSLHAAFVALALGVAAAPRQSAAVEPAATPAEPGDPPPAGAPEELIQAAPPPFSPGVFPCTQCHDGSGDRTRRALSHHEEVQEKFVHARSRRWCLDCHDFENRDMLHLTGGELVPFTQSYALCAQCHHGKYKDWRLGIHGKRVGSWDGTKTYLLCVSCHDPHTPAIKPLRPERRPPRPEETL